MVARFREIVFSGTESGTHDALLNVTCMPEKHNFTGVRHNPNHHDDPRNRKDTLKLAIVGLMFQLVIHLLVFLPR